ncbi:ATP-binding protein [Lentzea sp. NPDC006480]|uniref:ATP-binding protein n=1 Tax=Lentzea sp. NPDC006480 TaxID=3157176 RepID=UPI0033BB0347
MPTTRRRGLTEQAATAAIDQACRALRLPTIRAQFPDIAETAGRDQMSYRGFLAELRMAECDDRVRRRSERRIKAAAFPREKSLRGFDFDENLNVDPAVIHTLATCEWVKKGLPLCLIGDSGTGKSHLLIALGTEAAMAGFRVKYTWPPSWSTNSSRPPTTSCSPRRSPVTAASTFSTSTNSDTWSSTAAAPNSSSRC